MIEITQLFLTKNDCYKNGRTMIPIGIMRHSTGANNSFLSRYIQPDDGIIGPNKYDNHWNQPRPGGSGKCVHAFIGKDKNGKVRIYQTLPWNHVAWGSGSGPKGSANTIGYIQYEICEDALNDKIYFEECMRLANQLDAYLAKKYNIPITPTTLIDHAGGHKLGIASNHADIGHWARKFGYSMDKARADVKKLLGGDIVAAYKRGMKGSGVKKLQEDLIKLGYDLGPHKADGSFGADTDKAVRKFQKDNKLAVDGSAGPATQAKIKELLDKLSKTKTPVSTDIYYRVRKSWTDSKSQIGDYKDLDNAIEAARNNKGYFVFDENGKKIGYEQDNKISDNLVKENEQLKKENIELKNKLEQIKKIVK